MGGLSCAAILARLGRRVLVLEVIYMPYEISYMPLVIIHLFFLNIKAHPDVAGGATHQFNLKGYQFDSGLHYTVSLIDFFLLPLYYTYNV